MTKPTGHQPSGSHGPERRPIVMPEIGSDEAALQVGVWLVDLGDAVDEGDRVVEVILSGTTFDVSTPASGRMAEISIPERRPVRPGEILGWVTLVPDDATGL